MFIYGVHPLEELLQTVPEQVLALYSTRWESAALQQIVKYCQQHRIRRHDVDRDRLDEMAEGGNHQGVVAEIKDFQYTHLDDLIAKTADKTNACLIVLEQVQDPGNLGAIIRSAAALGMDGIIIPKDRAVGITPSVIRASAGMAFRMPVARVINISRTLVALRDHNYWAVGAAAQKGQYSWAIDFRMKTALVMGGEHQGIRPLVKKHCDMFVQIPIEKTVESMNVATAASILAYEIRRQWHC